MASAAGPAEGDVLRTGAHGLGVIANDAAVYTYVRVCAGVVVTLMAFWKFRSSALF